MINNNIANEVTLAAEPRTTASICGAPCGRFGLRQTVNVVRTIRSDITTNKNHFICSKKRGK
jgi:predicted ThiF/HesA family dinucleotide-utilizing enzyme